VGFMPLNEAVSKRILELCNQRNLTINKLANVCGITQSTLNDMVKCKYKSPNLKTIYYICFGLNIALHDFFNSSLFENIDE